MRRLTSGAVALMAACLAALAPPASADTYTAPSQPTSGPGGSTYSHPGAPFVSGSGGVGGYTIYEPNPRPTGTVPVVAVVHGNCVTFLLCRAGDITVVGDWNPLMTHLAKQGNIVVYPRYQSGSNTPTPTTQVQSAIDGIADALDYLESTPGATQPDRSRFGMVGHSRGGWIAVNAAALLEAQGLPHPDYVAAFAPGESSESGIPQEDWSTIPSDMKLIASVGETDTLAGEGQSRYGAGILYEDTTTISAANKDYVRTRSDTYNGLSLDADHDFATGREVDAMDWRGTWKLADALRTCTAYGTDCASALGDTPQQRHMGTWSRWNGATLVSTQAVKELCVTDDPSESWAASCANSLP